MPSTAFSFRHTRSTGLQHTYDVRVSGTEYIISLDGKMLKRAMRPAVLDGGDDDAMTREFAIADIESLHDMSEE